MKHISILVCILCVWFIAMAAAQQTRNTLTVSKHAIPTHRIWDAVQKHVRSSSHPNLSAHEKLWLLTRKSGNSGRTEPGPSCTASTILELL